MLSNCIICFDMGEEPTHPPNCPNCGRWLKWVSWEEGYSCKCNGIINIPGTGDDPDHDDSDVALRVCKVSHLQSSEGQTQ